jgi:hypothetical protein
VAPISFSGSAISIAAANSTVRITPQVIVTLTSDPANKVGVNVSKLESSGVFFASNDLTIFGQDLSVVGKGSVSAIGALVLAGDEFGTTKAVSIAVDAVLKGDKQVRLTGSKILINSDSKMRLVSPNVDLHTNLRVQSLANLTQHRLERK